jgi:ATP-dependent DNA helicase DinG
LVEAGTGTGKTLAYLIPALLLGLKTVVSTGTKTLQDQIGQKELVLLKKVMRPDLTWKVLKGRANYLCLRRYLDFSRQPDLSLAGARKGLDILEPWVQKTTERRSGSGAG